MFLRQELDKRKIIKNKIKELKSWIARSTEQPNDELMKVLLANIDKLQNINLLINKINQQTQITIGGTQLSLITAIEIRDTIKSKIDIITDLINTNDYLDIITLLEQRDNFIDEYNSINSTIRITDWNIKLD